MQPAAKPLAGRDQLGYYGRTMGNEGVQMLRYKVVEVNTVSEDILEDILNEWTAKGWRFDGIHFAMRESQKRPAMAFVLFTTEEGA